VGCARFFVSSSRSPAGASIAFATPHERRFVCRRVIRSIVATLACVTAFAVTPRRASADPSSVSPEQGYDLGQVPSPRAIAMGGAVHTFGTSATGLFYNPANLALARVYHFEAMAAFAPEARRQTYGGAVVDSITNRLAGGVGGTYSILDPDGIRRTWTDVRLALALPLGDRIAVGATGRYLHVNQSVASGPFGGSLASDGTPNGAIWDQLTFDAGVTAMPVSSLRVGLYGQNLSNPGNALAPMLLAGGVGFAKGDVTLEAGGQADFTTWGSTKWRANVGAELFLADHFPLRAGYRFDEGVRAHAISAGLGYVDRKWSFEVSGRRDVGTDNPLTVISLALRYFYDAAGGRPDEPMY
jgi:hypothetical protein